jgi:hypothetical protein
MECRLERRFKNAKGAFRFLKGRGDCCRAPFFFFAAV